MICRFAVRGAAPRYGPGTPLECGWCGDFGDLSSLPSARRAAADWKHKERAEQINQALLPLEQGAFSILEG